MFRNALVLLSADLIRIGFGIALTAVVARRLGAGPLGALAYMLALVNILAVIGDAGLSQFYIRAAQHDRGRDTLGAILLLRLVAGTLMAAGLVVYSTFVPDPDLRPLLLLGGMLLWQGIVTAWATAFLRARERMHSEGMTKVVSSILTLAGAVIVIRQGYGIVAVAAVMAGVSLLQGGYLFWVSLRLISSPLRLAYAPAVYGQVLGAAWPFAALALLGTIYFRIDSVMLFAMRGRDALGQYSAAYRVMEAGLLVPWVLSTSALPSVVRGLTTSPAEVLGASRRALHFLFAISIPLAVLGAVLAPQAFPLLYGSGFAEGAAVFRVLAFTLVAVYASSVTSTLIAAGPRPIVNAAIALIMVVENVALNFVVIPLWSGIGAAVATLATEVTGLILGSFYLRRVLGGPRYGGLLLKPLLGAACAGFVALQVPELGILPASVAVYLAVLWLSHDFSGADATFLRSLVTRAQPAVWTDPT